MLGGLKSNEGPFHSRIAHMCALANFENAPLKAFELKRVQERVAIFLEGPSWVSIKRFLGDFECILRPEIGSDASVVELEGVACAHVFAMCSPTFCLFA